LIERSEAIAASGSIPDYEMVGVRGMSTNFNIFAARLLSQDELFTQGTAPARDARRRCQRLIEGAGVST